MWRALVFIGLLCLAAFAAVWLADHPGTVAITWAGRELETSLGAGLVGIAVLAMLLALLWAAIRFLIGLPARLGEGSRVRRRERGHTALSRGIVAIGAGDVASARRYASEAERLVGHEPLALLLKAQTAQAAGDRNAAETAFRRMLDHNDTRVLGLRGLFLEARRRGDQDAARTSATQAARLAPSAAWANDAVLEGFSADGDWRSAIKAVERRSSLGLADRAETRRQRAVLHAADALARDEAGDPDAALAAAQEALRLAPDLVPAAALAGRILSRRGDLKKAARLVETAWRDTQHPDLAAAYLNLRPGDSAADRLARAETLARLSSWAPEARLAIARAAIEARRGDRARDALKPLLDERPTVRVCLMMAELEQAEGRAGRVREWLARAARAPQDKAWVADGIVSETWAPISPVTGRLDAFVWATPPEILGRPAHEGSDFLDLAMGQLVEPEPESERLTLGLDRPMDPDKGTAAGSTPVSPDAAAVSQLNVVPIEPPGTTGTPPVAMAQVAAGPLPAEPLTEAELSIVARSPTAARPAPIPLPASAASAGSELPGDLAESGDVAEPKAARPETKLVTPATPPRSGRTPTPVVFPFAQAPDDPGLAKTEAKRPVYGSTP